jgi:hypothetical protein
LALANTFDFPFQFAALVERDHRLSGRGPHAQAFGGVDLPSNRIGNWSLTSLQQRLGGTDRCLRKPLEMGHFQVFTYPEEPEVAPFWAARDE